MRVETRHDLRHIVILLLIAGAIGVYLMLTMVLIANDGVEYIRFARRLTHDPANVISKYPAGYLMIIWFAHYVFALLGADASNLSWATSAQAATLLFRILSTIPLYYVGKSLVGGSKSFLALLILGFLPYPARFISDVMRDWPFVLFLFCGLCLLLRRDLHAHWRSFFWVGAAAGIAYIIRVEGLQLLVYGVLSLTVYLCRRRDRMMPAHAVSAFLLMAAGFAVTCGWYIGMKQERVPDKLREFIDAVRAHQDTETLPARDRIAGVGGLSRAEYVPDDFVKGELFRGFLKILNRVSQNLLHFFAAPAVLGLYLHFRNRRYFAVPEFQAAGFMVVYIAMLLMLYHCYGYVSRRHVLPLTLMALYYVPDGLLVLAHRIAALGRLAHVSRRKAVRTGLCFNVLLAAGIIACLPKLLDAGRSDKTPYRTVAAWLSENTSPDQAVVSSDMRIPFYADREGIPDEGPAYVPARAAFVVKVYGGRNETLLPLLANRCMEEVFSVGLRKNDADHRIVVYEVRLNPKP
ncbi:MAG: hypothetical protein IH624_01970 [Phycisphaerae bacterium]|nr:hypothetical protein [Phycisphaerae bacterium]